MEEHMNYSKDEVIQFANEEDVKFIRLAFCDVFGKQKNISIMPSELERAFSEGIAFDASAIPGFGDESRSDLFLHPEAGTLMPLPWRPEQGRVVQMFSNITYPDGTPFECDTRNILKEAIKKAAEAGITFYIGSELEFYLFKLDDEGKQTDIPCDNVGYMDIGPEDKGENVRREICLTLEQMGIYPESSHHEEGPGQNEVDFRYSDALTAADNAVTFQRVVKTIANRNGLYADFSAKPLEKLPGNGFHINMSILPYPGIETFNEMIAGVLRHVNDMTVFMNPNENSYLRLGKRKAPGYISWSRENRSQLVRIPAATGDYRRMELRSPDPTANPYLAFALMIYAALDGIKHKMILPPSSDINLYKVAPDILAGFDRLPETLDAARYAALESEFVNEHIPSRIIYIYCKR